MKSNRPRPLDLTGTSKDEQPAVEGGLEAPEDLDLQQARFRADEALGAVVPTDERLVKTQDASADLPPLGLVEAAREQAAPDGPRPWPYYTAAAVLSALWSLGPIMFAWGYRREVVPFQNDMFALAVFAMLALGPAALVWIAAFLLHQGAKLAAEARRGQALADTLVQPSMIAARGAGTAVQLVRQEIVLATEAAGEARTELMALRDILAAESSRLVETAQSSHRTAAALTQELSAERERMEQLAGVLDAQAGAVAEAIGRHARMVAEASDLAQTQIREAEATLAARAADLASAAGEASDAARLAGDTLDRQVTRLETASLGVGDQVRAVEEGLTEQRAALVAIAHGMRADHEGFAAEIETQRAQLVDVLTHTRAGASELNETTARSGEALGRLIADAGGQLEEVARSAAEERDLFSAAATQSLTALAEIASREREEMSRQTQDTIDAVAASAENARKAAEAHAEGVRHQIDQLSESAFVAGQKADQVFQARLEEARSMIDQSAELVQDAGERSAAKLAEGIATARQTLNELESMLSDVDARVARLPADAEARTQSVRASIERGMEDLMASARKAAEETQSIDAAFQERVRRNYDMLSEAVRLMGVVAGAAGGASGTRSGQPRLSQTPLVSEPPREEPPAPTVEPPPRIEPPPQAEAAPTPESAEAAEAAEPSLRPRLKLTPTATDEEFKTVFESAGGREAPDPNDESWTWRELLSSMDEPQGEPAAVAERLIGEIEAMGIDAAALLPRARIDQIAAQMSGGDPTAGRVAARQLAPAAIRRLSRRMLVDRSLRAQADSFVRRYQGMIDDAAARPGEAMVLGALLGSDQGRAFLLLDVGLCDVG